MPGVYVRTEKADDNVQKMQSTEVFRVNLKPGQLVGSMRDRIIEMDDDLGLYVQDILWEYVDEIRDQFKE